MLEINDIEQKIKAKNWLTLSKCFTWAESTLIEENELIDAIICRNNTLHSKTITISISGIPGVGKSTFIESLGLYLHQLGKSIAVFAIDPSSELTGGSILGDKTRMNQLSALPNVFIRPSPSSNQLGGLGVHTHKNIDIAKIAEFDIILIETVGVGQSETIVRNLSDIFILLLMPGSGDELQGIKKGIMEVADVFIINKADGELKNKADQTFQDINSALHYSSNQNSLPYIALFSSIDTTNIETIWDQIAAMIERKQGSSMWIEQRIKQKVFWFEYDLNQKILQKIKLKYADSIELIKNKLIKGELIDFKNIISIFDL